MEITLNRLRSVLTAQAQRNDIVANNLANMNSNGFKREVTFFDSLNEQLTNGIKMETVTSFQQGNLQQTDNPLDVALKGEGLFSVATDQGEAYTRDGHFQLDQDGVLKTLSGNPVLGEGGWIVMNGKNITPNEIQISRDGSVFVDDVFVDKLKIVTVSDVNELQKSGGNLFEAKADAEIKPVEMLHVEQGFLENSNVNPVEEMMALVELQRAFESSQSMIRGLDEVYKTAVNQLSQY